MHNTCRKNACFEKIVDHLTLEVGEGDQRKIIRALAERYGVDLKALADGQMMTWDETRQLAGDPLVTIGAHTHDHFAMARLNADAACEDVTRGLERLEKELPAAGRSTLPIRMENHTRLHRAMRISCGRSASPRL